jgi:hypothetical protein
MMLYSYFHLPKVVVSCFAFEPIKPVITKTESLFSLKIWMIFFLETASNGCASPKLESVIINSLVSASFAGILFDSIKHQ